jgi:hypothetical protein
VRHLDQDARAVAGQRVATRGAPVHEVPEDLDPLLDDVVRGLTLDVGHETGAAGIVLELRIVEAFARRIRHSVPDVGERVEG